MTFGRFAVLLFAAFVAGCASTPASHDVAGGATLEVENRTPEDLNLSLRGRSEGLVRSGTRVRFRHLPAGAAEVHVRATSGGAGAFSAKTELSLVAGEIRVWSIVPDAAGGPPLSEVPGLGALRVTNPTHKDITVLVDGVRVGRVFAGEERRFDDLPAKIVRLVGRPDDGTAESAVELMLVADAEAAWRYQESGAELIVENATDEALELTVDGEARGRVGPGESLKSLEAPGTRLLQARSEPSRRPYEAVLALSPAEPTTWKVLAGQAVLVVENDTGEALEVTVPGKPVTTVPAKEAARFEELPTGALDVRARGATSGLVFAVRLELLPAQVTSWVAGPYAGSIRIENRTPRVVTVYTTLGGQERERGVVQPGAVVLIRDLPRTAVGLSAIAIGIPRRQATTIDLSETPAATWVIASVAGAVRVVNERDEAIDAYVDALRVGEVPARGERTFTGVEVTEHLVECVGQKSGAAHAERVHVDEEVLAVVTVRDTNAWVVVDNTSGEALATRGLLAEQVQEIPAGASIKFRVRAGEQRLVVVGRDSGLAYGHALKLSAGESALWQVRLEPGRLVVWSRLDETAAVTIDDRAQGTLAPDETMAIVDLAPGRHRVQLVGLRTSLVRGEDVAVPPGGDARVTFATELGVLLVENRSQERVEVTIDGALYGDSLAGAIHAFGKVAPGDREVELYFTVSHRTQKVALPVREGQRVRIVAEAPLGLLVFDNSARQDVRVSIDGRIIATIPADAGPTLVNAPAGSRHVQLTRMGDHSELGFQLQVHADSAIHLPVPPKTIRLVVVNRGERALKLYAGERPIGEIGARASSMFEELPDGEARLFARDEAGVITHEERRVLHAGETATWVLDSPR